MNLADPRTAINELVTALTALTLPASFDPAEPAAFDKVKIFDLQDLAKAMEELFVYDNRICLVGLDAVDHSSQVVGRSLRVNRSLDLTLIFSDRRYSDRQKAMMGDATTPGALLLQKVIVDDVAGELPSGAVIVPSVGRLIALELEKRADQTGRIVFTQDLSASLDWQAIPLSRNARIAAT